MVVYSPIPPELLKRKLGWDSRTMGTDRNLYLRKKFGINGLEDYFARKLGVQITRENRKASRKR